jgi:chemotaxis protein CheZ
MAEPRKVFRIEQTAVARRAGAGGCAHSSAHSPAHYDEIVQALGALQSLMAATSPAPEAAAPVAGRDTTDAGGNAAAVPAKIRTHIAAELDAVAAGSALATQKILAAAEEIDQLADSLSAALKDRIEQDLAHDIADGVLRIFEACNFQDLIGQRVAKVRKTLAAGAVAAPHAGNAAPHLHGPRLDTDRGHLTQREIDALFGD